MNIILGVDPGKNGAIVRLYEDIVNVKEWTTTKDAWEFLKWVSYPPIITKDCKVFAVLEKVTRPAKLVGNAGEWRGLLTALGISFKEVTPQIWQKHFGVFPKEKRARKNALKQKAQQLYPNLDITLKTADALLLAEYAKEVAWK